MDWWESKRLVISKSDNDKSDRDGSASPKLTVDITCTPGQHFTGRTMWDHFRTLWAGWVIEEVVEEGAGSRTGKKVYFGGDTAYRSVLDGEDENKVPVCPAFEAIGKRFGGFDVALIPIGWVFFFLQVFVDIAKSILQSVSPSRLHVTDTLRTPGQRYAFQGHQSQESDWHALGYLGINH